MKNDNIFLMDDDDDRYDRVDRALVRGEHYIE